MRTVRQKVTGFIALAAMASGALISTISPVGVSPAAAAAVNIRLININDFHGRVAPNFPDAGNTVRFAGAVEQARAASPTPNNHLFLAAGDLVGASTFESNIQNDDPAIDVLNALDLQASALGNHELDKGRTDLDGHIEPRSEWSYLCANCYDAGTSTPAYPGRADPIGPGSRSAEYATFTVGGVTVGVIGAVVQEPPVSPAGVATLRFGNPVEAVNRVAAQLSDGNPANGEAQILVAEYHDGADVQPPLPSGPPPNSNYSTPESLAEAMGQPAFADIANNTSNLVDVIFNGHTHKAYRFDVPVPGQPARTRPIVQAGQYGERLGIVDLVVDDLTGTVASYTSSIVTVSTSADENALAAMFPRVAEVRTIRDAANAYAARPDIGGRQIATITADITSAYAGGSYVNGVYTGGTRDDRANESTLGNLVADALLATLQDPDYGGAEIAVTNSGGLRSELLHNGDGIITVKEAVNVLPFANTLMTITLTGAQLKTLLEQQDQRLSNGTVPARAYQQLGLSKNLTYTTDRNLAEGSRITSITVNGAPVDPARKYRVGGFSFLIDGGDNYHVFRQGTNKEDSGLVDRDAWIAYLTASSPVAPDFARRSVRVSGGTYPTYVEPGQVLNFTVSNLDLTSLGSPQNTQLDVYVGGQLIGTAPVTNGAALVNMTVPSSLSTAARALVLSARPTGTLVNGRTINAIPPHRLFDTRGASEILEVLRPVQTQKVGGDYVLRVRATDLPGLVPAQNVSAVSLNVAVTNPDADGFVTVYPCGTRELVASVNYVRGETVSNAVIAPVTAGGDLCFYSLVPTDIVVDINGWMDGGYVPVTPTRVFDTRGPSFSPNALRSVTVAKVSGDPALEVSVTDLGTDGSLVPGGKVVGAVSLNVAVTNPSQDGFVTVYPCGTRQLVATVNYLAGQTVSNALVVPVSETGTLCFYSLRPTDIVVDINGWFAASSSFRGVEPNRLFDTRPGQSPNALVPSVPKTKIGGSTIREVKVTDVAGVPAAGVALVSLNVAVTNPEGPGYVTVYPCGERNLTASVNYITGETVSNTVLAPVSANGTVCFFSYEPTDIVVDVNGWFMA